MFKEHPRKLMHSAPYSNEFFLRCYLDMVHPFSMTIPGISMTCNNVMSLIYDRWCHSTSMVITQKFNNIL